MPTTDHGEIIGTMRRIADTLPNLAESERTNLFLAADLLEAHDETGISLDEWANAREFVERYAGKIQENHV